MLVFFHVQEQPVPPSAPMDPSLQSQSANPIYQPQPINPMYPQPMDPSAAQPQNGMYQPQPYVVQANPVYQGTPSQFVAMPPNVANRPME